MQWVILCPILVDTVKTLIFDPVCDILPLVRHIPTLSKDAKIEGNLIYRAKCQSSEGYPIRTLNEQTQNSFKVIDSSLDQ